MEDNNYPTTKREFEEGEPQLKSSPLGNSSPGTSPFQDEIDDGMRIPDNIDYLKADYIETQDSDDTPIGDHTGFAFANGYSSRVGAKLAIIVPLMLIIGAALGGFAIHSYYFGFKLSSEQSAAVDAVNAVYDYAKDYGALKVVFTDVYVKDKADEFECMVFAAIEYSAADFRTESFRVVAEKDTDKTEVFKKFDQEEFDRLDSSPDSGDNIMAQLLLGQKHEYDRCIADIVAGKWVNVDPSYTSARINRKAAK